MKKAAVDINKGGSLLYLVNTIPETLKVKRALNVMSDISNAKCISGSNVDDLLKEVKNNTAAYYELAIFLTPQMGENFQLKVKCKRKGVRLNTLQYFERAKSYAQMEVRQRELYALNVVMGGSWSRMMGTVKPVSYRNIRETPGNKITIRKISIIIPEELKGRKLDVFVLNVDPTTLKADISMNQLIPDDPEHLYLEFKAKKGKQQYIVIVEPEKTHCIFTKVS